jgi:hypothetical protein
MLTASENRKSIRIFVHKKEKLSVDGRKFQDVDASLHIIRTKKA